MKKSVKHLLVFLAAFLFLNAGGSSNAAPSQREFFHYRPHPEPLQYNLSITTTSRAFALFGPGPQEEHEDLLRLSVRVVTVFRPQVQFLQLNVLKAGFGHPVEELCHGIPGRIVVDHSKFHVYLSYLRLVMGADMASGPPWRPR